MNVRSLLYRLASLLGDVNAIRRGRIGQRIVYKTETRLASKLVRKLFK